MGKNGKLENGLQKCLNDVSTYWIKFALCGNSAFAYLFQSFILTNIIYTYRYINKFFAIIFFYLNSQCIIFFFVIVVTFVFYLLYLCHLHIFSYLFVLFVQKKKKKNKWVEVRLGDQSRNNGKFFCLDKNLGFFKWNINLLPV